MSVNKLVKFYVFEPQPSMYNNGLSERSTISLLQMVLSNGCTYKFPFENENYTLDIIEMGTTFVFGSCAKEREISKTSFLQIRDKETNQTEPYSLSDPEKQLEVYTYFYIDCNRNRMVAIQHKNISRIHSILQDFIFSQSRNMLKIFIAPEKIADIRKATKSLNRSNRLRIAYAPGKSKCEVKPLLKAFGDFEFDSYSVEIKLSSVPNDENINRIINLSENEKENFDNILLYGKNEFGLEEAINFFESVHAKNYPFEITEDSATNVQYIKQKLSEIINKY